MRSYERDSRGRLARAAAWLIGVTFAVSIGVVALLAILGSIQ